MQHSTFVTAIISAVIAATVSFGTTLLTISSKERLEMSKLFVTVQNSVIQKLIQARLEAYPVAYGLVSQLEKDAFDKLPDEKKLNRKDLEELRLRFEAWDSSKAHLLSRDSSDIVWSFRQKLLTTISECKREDFSCKNLEELFNFGEKVEFALRSDLGIFGLVLRELEPEELKSDLEKPNLVKPNLVLEPLKVYTYQK